MKNKGRPLVAPFYYIEKYLDEYKKTTISPLGFVGAHPRVRPRKHSGF